MCCSAAFTKVIFNFDLYRGSNTGAACLHPSEWGMQVKNGSNQECTKQLIQQTKNSWTIEL